jgi:hypothetical protein
MSVMSRRRLSNVKKTKEIKPKGNVEQKQEQTSSSNVYGSSKESLDQKQYPKRKIKE